ncbi:hypothetical protein DVA86_05910 [Streptomyces armeniacus]|uniref:Uncharacterized protein n=1 Tax=Streptomyces armeniacus TaxID=83291 RepID=A0A345XZP7_9ACTN|nr:hypothetical protein DVA86_05910 [Streptomyces armeniacus]
MPSMVVDRRPRREGFSEARCMVLDHTFPGSPTDRPPAIHLCVIERWLDITSQLRPAGHRTCT